MATPFTPAQRKERLDDLIATHNIQIDLKDYKAALKYTWSLHKNEQGYICIRTTPAGQQGKMLKLHRFIMYRKRGYKWWSKRYETMHLDGNVFNVKRDNLAIGTHTLNLKLNNRNTSGYPNVYWHKAAKKWRVQICVNYKRIVVGNTHDLEEAALCGYEAALYYHNVQPPARYYELLDKQLADRLALRIA